MRNTQNHLNVLQSYLISCEPTEYVQVIVAHMRVKNCYFKQIMDSDLPAELETQF